MARPIDLDQLMKYPLRRGSEHCDEKNADPRFLNGVESILEWAQTLPTLAPPNEPLTLDELREIDEPVWVACKPIEGGNGYWCLCQHGHIITPAGNIFDAKEIPHWVFYRRPPEGAGNA